MQYDCVGDAFTRSVSVNQACVRYIVCARGTRSMLRLAQTPSSARGIQDWFQGAANMYESANLWWDDCRHRPTPAGRSAHRPACLHSSVHGRIRGHLLAVEPFVTEIHWLSHCVHPLAGNFRQPLSAPSKVIASLENLVKDTAALHWDGATKEGVRLRSAYIYIYISYMV